MSDLTRAQIRRLLKRQRGAMADLARTLGVDPSTITQVLKGKSDSARILSAARELADAINNRQEGEIRP